jgi:hypothetical protein
VILFLLPFPEALSLPGRNDHSVGFHQNLVLLMLHMQFDEILKVLPESPPYYPDDMVTDQTERFWVSEIIREKVIHQPIKRSPINSRHH